METPEEIAAREEQEKLAGKGTGTVIIDGVEIKTTLELTEDEKRIAAEKAAAEQKAADEQKAAEEAAKKETDKNKKTVNIIIDVDGEEQSTEYELDDDGNAVKDGAIVYTKQQLLDAGFENNSEEEDEFDKDDIHQVISKVSGLELLDENGQPVTFKNGIEGLAEREVFVKDTFYKKGQEDALNDVFSKNPDLYDMYSYKVKHGSLDNYSKSLDFSKLEITDSTTDDELKSIIREQLLAIGNDATTVEKLIRLSENDETLKVDALEALSKLKEIQKQKSLLIQKQQQDAAQIEEENIRKYYGITVTEKGEVIDLKIENSLYDKIVNKGIINDIMIPKDGIVFNKDNKKQKLSRLDVFAYFYNPVTKDGLTQADVDEHNRLRDTNNFILQGIKNLTGGDISSIVKNLQNTIRLGDAKKIVRMSSGNSQGGKKTIKDLEKQIQKGTARIIM